MAKVVNFKVEFISSSGKPEDFPKKNFPEFAFIGRSNVGKSSLINSISGKSGLAKVSSQPGKTQTINHFMVNDQFYLVDMPGYGYAKVSKVLRENWQKFSRWYLTQWPHLLQVFVLIDSRISPQKIDIEFINMLGEKGVPVAIVYTKCDKPKLAELEATIKSFEDELSKYWENLPISFRTSSIAAGGTEILKEYILSTYKKTISI